MKRTVETHGKPWGGPILILTLVLCVFGWRVNHVQATFDGYQGNVSPSLSDSSFEDRDRRRRGEVEPDAGQWRTWLLTSGQQFRLPAPPRMRATRDELDTLRELAATRDAVTLDLINHWNTGGSSYRWNEIARNLVVKHFGRDNGPNSRALALVHVAVYDAMVATWDSKYFHNRRRPGDFSPRLSTSLPTPTSPSYPSEFAVAAGAASAVLSHLFPQDENFLNQQAEAAGMSRLLAGVEYPSDVAAGLELGRRVAALAIQYEIATGDIPNGGWIGTVPTDPGLWKPAPGTIPAGVTAGGWKPWVLSSGNQLRPESPFPEKPQELAEVKNFPRTAFTNQAAYFWQNNGHPGAAYAYWNDQVSRKILEYGLVFTSRTIGADIWSLPIDADRSTVHGPLTRMTQDLADDYDPTLSMDGGTLAFRSRRAGQFDIFLRNLKTGEETMLTQTPADDFPVISPDGARVAYSFRQNGKTPIFSVAANGGAPEELCGDCGEVEQWAPSGREILYVTADDPSGIGLLKVGSSPNRAWLKHPGYGLFNARLSPDGRWVSFSGRPNRLVPAARVFIAEVRDSIVSSEKEWIGVTADGDAPSWSPHAGFLYFWSNRDGSPCLWAQGLDPITKRPTGAPLSIQHFHSRALSWRNLYLGAPDVAVAFDKVVFNLGGHTGNIWMTDLPPLTK